jgi:nicotinamidase-related amidase
MTLRSRRSLLRSSLAACAVISSASAIRRTPGGISLSLKNRTKDREPRISQVTVEARRMAIVACDMWTAHSCSGFNQNAALVLPRIISLFDASRKLGIPIVFAPSGADLEKIASISARTKITLLPHHSLPTSNGFLNGHGSNGPFASSCMCKIVALQPGTSQPLIQCNRVQHDYNQTPVVPVTDKDFFIAAGHYREGTHSAIRSWGEPAQQELWNFVQERGITHLLYVGFATNMCIINREFAMIQMKRLGLQPILIRDATLSITYNGYNPMTLSLDPLFTPEFGTGFAVEYIEQRVGPSIDSAQIIHAAYNA